MISPVVVCLFLALKVDAKKHIDDRLFEKYYSKNSKNISVLGQQSRNMTGIEITGFIVKVPLNHYPRYKSVMQDFHLGMFQLLQEKHNFSILLTYKNYSEKNNFLLLNGLPLTASDDHKFKFLMPFFKLRTRFYFRKAKKSNVSFTKPFAFNTWIASVVLMIVITLILKLTLITSEAEETSWIFSAMTVFSTICQDGDDPSPSTKDLACKITFFALLIFSLLLFNYYTSVMVAQLLGDEEKHEIILEDLIKSKYRLAFDDNSFVKEWLRDNKIKKVNIIEALPPAFGIHRAREAKFCYHTDVSTGFHLIGHQWSFHDICELYEIKIMPDISMGMAVPEQFKYFKQFQISLLKLRENGLVHRWLMRSEVTKPECHLDSDVVPLELEQLLGGLLCMLCGILSSCIILGGECFWMRYKNTR